MQEKKGSDLQYRPGPLAEFRGRPMCRIRQQYLFNQSYSTGKV